MTKAATTAQLERRSSDAAARLPDLLAAAEHAAHVVIAGRHGRQRAGPSDTFWQFRDYALGDPIHSIDWRQSARLEDRLLVRQTEWEQPQTLLLWCGGDEDFDYGGKNRDTKRFRGQVLTLALAILALRGGERVGLWGSHEPPKSGTHAVPALAQELLLHERNYSQVPPHPGAAVVLISDFHEDPALLHKAFQTVRHAHGQPAAIVVEDPDEELFPYEGALRFEGPRAAVRRFFGDAAAVKAQYLQKRAAHLEVLQAAAKSSREAVLVHSTANPLTPVLLQLSELLIGSDQ